MTTLTDLTAIRDISLEHDVRIWLFLTDRHNGDWVRIGHCRVGTSDLASAGCGSAQPSRNMLWYNLLWHNLHVMHMPISEMPMMQQLDMSDAEFLQAHFEVAYEIVREFWETKYCEIVKRLRDYVSWYNALT